MPTKTWEDEVETYQDPTGKKRRGAITAAKDREEAAGV